jgi:hypothetical protein
MVLWYVGAYLILSTLMIMMLFVSGDFKKDYSNVCDQNMIIAYLILILTPCTNFVIAYLNFRHITKTY